jgi:hypothetical protein
MNKALVFCLLAISVLANVAEKDQDGFYILNASNFNEFLKENPRSLVLFCENNNQGCEAALRVFPEAAAQLANDHPELKIAKISKETNDDFIRDLGVGAYPHVRLYTNPSMYAIYADYIEKVHIYGFLKLRLSHSPVIRKIDQDDNYSKFQEEELAIYLSSPELDETQTRFALDVQSTFPDIPVYVGVKNTPIDQTLIPDAKLQYRFLLKRSFDEGDKMITANDSISPSALIALVNAYRDAKVPRLTKDHVQKLFRFRMPVMILFDKDLQSESVKNFGKAIENLNFQGLFLKATLKDPHAFFLADLFGVSEADLPTLRIMTFGVTRMHRYRLNQAVTLTDIKTFIGNYIQKKVDEYFREEEPHYLTNKGLKKLVRSNVSEITSNSERDTIVLYISEKSPNHNQIVKAFDNVAEGLKYVPDIMLARINLDKNDFAHLNLTQLPLIHIFKRGKEVSPPAKYTGEQTPEEILAFVSEKLGRKLEMSKVTDEL